jgi:asparagine synthase (glutamine-hydrolysing)
MIHNGEIYNHQELRDGVLAGHSFRTNLIQRLLFIYMKNLDMIFCNLLDDFAFVVLNGDDFMAARDPLGVKPLYYGLDERGRMYFASEMKSITDQCVTLSTFPPGHFYTAGSGFVKYFRPEYEDYLNANQELDLAAIMLL